MKLILQILLTGLFLVACSKNDNESSTPYLDDDLAGPISRPQSGYGADGTYTVAKVSFASPLYNGKNVYVFYPKELTGTRQTIF